jgi:hypothetical protein
MVARGMQVRALPLHCMSFHVFLKYSCYLNLLYIVVIGRGTSTGSIAM